jgi:hypothetical protein
MNAVNHDRESQAPMAALQLEDHAPSGWDPFEVWQRFFQHPRAQHDAQLSLSGARNPQVSDLSVARSKLRINSNTVFSASTL